MESFFQLARRKGASAESSLLLHYGSDSLPVVLYRSIASGHSTVFLGAFISLLLAISVPFASEVLHITTTGTCTGANSGKECNPQLELRGPLAKFEAAVLGISFCAIACLAMYYAKRPTGIRGEASSIAGMATLLHDPLFLDKIHRLSRTALKSDREMLLQENFFAIAELPQEQHQSSPPQSSIQLRPRPSQSSNIVYSSLPANHENHTKDKTLPITQNPSSPLVMSRASMLLMALLLISLLVLILYNKIVGTSSGFERFMDSQSMGVRFLMTTLGVLIKFYWVSLEKEIRTREPYRRLSLGKARPEHTILVASRSHPLTALSCNLLRCHFFLAFLALVALLSEVLTVALAGVPFSSAQSYNGYLVSTYLSVSIIALMLVALGLAIFRRTDDLHLPYPLGSILSTMLYLCNSCMLEDFKNLSSLDTRTRNRRIVSWGKRYKLADLDGGVTFGVDYDESTERVMVEGLQIETKR